MANPLETNQSPRGKFGEQMNDMDINFRDLLKKWNLSQYADKLQDEGWDDALFWHDIDQTMLQNLGFKNGHINKFIKKSKELHKTTKNNNKTNPSTPTSIYNMQSSGDDLSPIASMQHASSLPLSVQRVIITREEEEAMHSISSSYSDYIIMIASVKKKMRTVNSRCVVCKEEINKFFEYYMTQMNKRKEYLLADLNKIQSQKLTLLDTDKKLLEQYCKILSDFEKLISVKLMDPSYDIRKRKKKILQNSEKLLNAKPTALTNSMSDDITFEYNSQMTQNDRKNGNNVSFFNENYNNKIDILQMGSINGNLGPMKPSMTVQNITAHSAEIVMEDSVHCKSTKFVVELCELTKTDNYYKVLDGNDEKANMDLNWVNKGECVGDVNRKSVFGLKEKCGYLVRCHAKNEYGQSDYCKAIFFVTKRDQFRMKSVILSDEEKNILYDLLAQKWVKCKLITMKLLYRASRDSFNSDVFYEKCCVPNTFCVIESDEGMANNNNNNVFGGYSRKAWPSHNNKYKEDNHAFLYLLRSADGYTPNIFDVNPSYSTQAIYRTTNHMLVFGGAQTLYIESNKGGHTGAKHSKYFKFPKNVNNVFLGAKSNGDFIPKEIEVYQVIQSYHSIHKSF